MNTDQRIPTGLRKSWTLWSSTWSFAIMRLAIAIQLVVNLDLSNQSYLKRRMRTHSPSMSTLNPTNPILYNKTTGRGLRNNRIQEYLRARGIHSRHRTPPLDEIRVWLKPSRVWQEAWFKFLIHIIGLKRLTAQKQRLNAYCFFFFLPYPRYPQT